MNKRGKYKRGKYYGESVQSDLSSKEIEFNAHFTNNTANIIDLVWKGYYGQNYIIRRDIMPGDSDMVKFKRTVHISQSLSTSYGSKIELTYEFRIE